MAMPDHERCAGCGWERAAPGGDTLIYCQNKDCGWRAPSWAQWDRVMRAAREVSELRAGLKRAVDNCDRIRKEHDAAISADREREARQFDDDEIPR